MSFDEFEQEIISLENFNETLNNFNNDIYLKDFEVGNNYEAFEEQDEIINYVKNVEFTPCVVIDFVEGKIQRCEEKTKLRQLRNLFGGHIHHRSSKGKKAKTCTTEELHADNITKELEYLRNWLINFVQTENYEVKKKILTKTFEILLTFCEITPNCNTTSATNTTTNEEKISLNEPPSLLMIKILFKEISRKKKKENVNDYEKLRREFGQNL
ncbi:hypothetical protein GLOIN_2v1803841 [Rhizophagus clarus]|uniref:Uncharacterized protein n=1 Tax=Rhizophagus clarus TaxID=94130 RepID=A0A8H3LHK8_9GLOM|nr:hypothetical protein GLOIN_2v1803841 [Rhizophagus clarus]